VAGFEALLRWRDQSGRLRPPAAIASAFENTDLALALGERMRDAVVRDMRGWRDAGLDFGHVAINVAEAEFRNPRFAEHMLAALAEAGLPPSLLQIEITENVLLERDADRPRAMLQMFREEGVTIALDDFGTGYASLRHLKHFPFDVLKIDRSFVSDIESDPGDAAIVRAVVGLGRSLGKQVVAEGVETPAQARFLREEGCHFAQGYLYSQPVSAHKASAMCRPDWGLVGIASPPGRRTA
jgi:EAL domain-containing protein (putative c-di-GMP-specific phosphodiesterase class I)